ncbi:tRNA (guanine(26)-N(2))-dimethyltransferase, mitochondrial-like protein [Acrodontium crateriforme]|uniref:tRNA (guanine(26)-N(2))-dimethyltransferase n=1 Tax=Acrodontium crateriforme TaxID=150365 RepID=A0AAQ3R958_9PEZI|nr:tRNA (guanine(26)-N(2))-dimethyltransferase, mitochondrial-like protein [Acrodontium crateriforme]
MTFSTMAAAQSPVPLSATPIAGQLVEHQGKTYETIQEGQAFILIPPNTRKSQDPQSKGKTSAGDDLPQNVFYNPIQQFNRDLSVLAIKAFGEDLCQRRTIKHEQDLAKHKAKKDRKRKRPDGETAEEANGGSVKFAKIENGSAEPTTAGSLEQPTEQSNTETSTNGAEPWKPNFRILDALSATGLRALRYAQEVPFSTSIVANDMSKKAVESIQINVEHNKLTSKITANTGNAMGHMYATAFPAEESHGPQHVNLKYDVIDLDPYGTATPFIDSALQALNDGGMLCVTCTDSGVFASTGYSEKTYSLYGGMPAKGSHSHETALRIILNSIASSAARYGLAIEPLLSLSIDYYVRMFVRVRKSPAEVKFLSGKAVISYECDVGCGAWTIQPLGRNTKQSGKNEHVWYKHTIAQAPSANRMCDHCGSKTHIAGPMWGGPIHNAAFVEKILSDLDVADPKVYQTKPRIEGMLDTALDELSVIHNSKDIWKRAKLADGTLEILPKTPPETLDLHPFFFIPSALAKVIHCQAPSEAALKGALRHAGYKATRSHCKPGSTKTNAPWPVVWEIMREWVRQKSPLKEGSLKETSPGWKIMQAARQVVDEVESTEAVECDSKEETPDIVTESKDVPETPVTEHEKPQDVSKMKIVFDEALGRDKPGKKLVRYQQNPRENWGPMARAKGSG